jgi:hypothetical protein
MTRATDYLDIAMTVLLTVYGQLVMKWRVSLITLGICVGTRR